MQSSRDIGLLRPDVAVNCRVFLRRCEAAGLPAAVTQTLRDDAYQAWLYEQGRSRAGKIVTNSRRTTFHGAGLAFDICKNVRGEEYSDAVFFERCGAIGRALGFGWGGDWKKIPDRPHFQWDDGGRYTGAMIRAGRLPPCMPAQGEEEEELTQERFNELLEGYFQTLREKGPSDYSADARAWAEEAGIIRGNAAGQMQYKMFCTREQMVTFLKRLEESRQ